MRTKRSARVALFLLLGCLAVHVFAAFGDCTAEGTAMATPHVVVIGGGLAGCSAALEAANDGATVTLLEKTKNTGGNSAKATSGMNGYSTPQQMASGVHDDTAALFEADTTKSGTGGNADAGLISTLVSNSTEAVAWIAANTGLSLSAMSQLGGHCRRRTHREPDTPDGAPVPVGFTIMRKLVEKLRTVPAITIRTEAAVTAVRPRDGGGYSVAFTVPDGDGSKEEALDADRLVMATGGYANDHTESSLLKEFAPHLATVPTTNGPWATGDGVKLIRPLGAALVDMDKVQLHPTGFLNPKQPAAASKFLGPEALRGSGGILLAPGKGTRFTNELGLRSAVSRDIEGLGVEYPGSGRPFAYCVLGPAAVKLFGPAQLGFYKDKVGLFREAKDTAELAALVDSDEATVRATLDAYAAAAAAGRCEATGKAVFPAPIEPEGPFVVAVITPCIHYTMGGLAVDSSARILDAARQPLPNLYGAGEVTGGVHGANRLGGNSLLECVVFGRIAGRGAAAP